MKKILITSFFICICLAAKSAYADTPPATISANQTLHQTAASAAAELLASTTRANDERHANAINLRVGKKLDTARTEIAGAFEDAIAKLQELMSRIQAQMIKKQTAGDNVTGAQTMLDDAQVNLQIANADLSTFENMLAQPIATNERWAKITNLKNQAMLTKDDFISVRNQIIALAQLLKTQTATSTPEASSTTN